MSSKQPRKRRVYLTYDQAVERIPTREVLHTLRQGGPGMLFGADMDRQAILNKFQLYPIELAGEIAQSLNHGIVITDETGPLFIETLENWEAPYVERARSELKAGGVAG